MGVAILQANSYMVRCVLTQERVTLARDAITSAVEAMVDTRRLGSDPRVAMDIAFAAAGGGHGMTQRLEQTSHPKLSDDQSLLAMAILRGQLAGVFVNGFEEVLRSSSGTLRMEYLSYLRASKVSEPFFQPVVAPVLERLNELRGRRGRGGP